MRIDRPEATRRDTLNLRIQPDVRGLIDDAAALLSKSRTAFVLDAARAAAEDTLMDRIALKVSPQGFADFQALLDRPPAPSERLRRTLQTPAPWD